MPLLKKTKILVMFFLALFYSLFSFKPKFFYGSRAKTKRGSLFSVVLTAVIVSLCNQIQLKSLRPVIK